MIDVPTRNGRLASPVRNRYFYGKLLDVEQLEREQRYFVEGSRLINRLTLGAGVLCGLWVRERNGKIEIGPGVAVDGFGREIVVTDPFVVDDPWKLTDECGDPTGETSENGPVVLCLAYHECLADPAPVLVGDCEIREECEHGAVRERYRLLVHKPEEVDFPPAPCSFGPSQPTGEVDPRARTPVVRRTEFRPQAMTAERSAVELRLAAIREEIGVRPAGQSTGLRELLCGVLRPSCGPGSHCVPLALVTRDAETDTPVPDPCAARTTIYSNAVLLDLILCLAEKMEQCCDRRVTVTAPVVKDTFPAPAQVIKAKRLGEETKIKEGGIAISFSRAMNSARLEAPAEWLRVVAIARPRRTEGGTPPARILHAELELHRTEGASLDGSEGFTAYYRFLPVVDQEGVEQEFLATLAALDVDVVRFLVVARSDDVTQIVDAEDAPELLDADYAGTKLAPSMLDLFWDLGELLPVLPSAIVNSIGFPPDEDPPQLPSGNGIEGGVFHSYFDVAPKEEE